jgi:hypothetical protein
MATVLVTVWYNSEERARVKASVAWAVLPIDGRRVAYIVWLRTLVHRIRPRHVHVAGASCPGTVWSCPHVMDHLSPLRRTNDCNANKFTLLKLQDATGCFVRQPYTKPCQATNLPFSLRRVLRCR